MKLKFFFILFLSLCVISLAACKKNKVEIIEFDNTYPLALAPDVQWAVITEPYATYKQNIGWDSPIEGHCRKGDVLQILGNASDDNGEIWYRFLDGWLHSSCLTVYSNRYKAQSVSDSLKDKN